MLLVHVLRGSPEIVGDADSIWFQRYIVCVPYINIYGTFYAMESHMPPFKHYQWNQWNF